MFKLKSDYSHDDIVENSVDNNLEKNINLSVDTDAIRQKNINSINETKREKIEVARIYVQQQFAKYMDDDNIKLLIHNIELYSEGVMDKYTPVKVRDLKNEDLYMFGWNIHNHFGLNDRDDIAKLLKEVFKERLVGVAERTIRSKLSNSDSTKITKVHDIASFSPDEE